MAGFVIFEQEIEEMIERLQGKTNETPDKMLDVYYEAGFSEGIKFAIAEFDKMLKRENCKHD